MKNAHMEHSGTKKIMLNNVGKFILQWTAKDVTVPHVNFDLSWKLTKKEKTMNKAVGGQ